MAAANLTTDLLENSTFLQIATALRGRADSIVRRWEEAVRALLPGADELTLTQVRDHIPEIIEQLATALASRRPGAVQELRDSSQTHGAVRFHQQYNVRELIQEYRLLRRIVIEEVYEATGGQLNATEMIVLDMGVDTAFQQGLLTFINHQREQIQAATETESKYLRFLSHDLRNNLNQVVLVLELLRSRLDGMPNFAEDLNDVSTAHRTILNTISGMDALLQAERLRKGAVQPKSEPVQLPALVQDVTRHLGNQAREKGLRLQTRLPAEATVHSDRELMALVLQNLLGNAIKYSSKGRIEVSVAEMPADLGGGWTIAIADEGPGISPENTRRIFDAFARGETHGQPGVGLGLAIAAEAAKLLGARLTVESTVGVGSTFRLILPAVREHDSAQP